MMEITVVQITNGHLSTSTQQMITLKFQVELRTRELTIQDGSGPTMQELTMVPIMMLQGLYIREVNLGQMGQ